ncbi:MAG: leucyl/phenylalanyl-tRNA--protein transferase [Chthoniobacterales bacterium]
MASRENQNSQIPPEILLKAYRMGIFPMGGEEEISWFSPDPRGIIPLDSFRLPHGLRRALNASRWEIRVNTRFEEVMRSCAKRSETWIDECILNSYVELHALGHAHSVETWLDGELAGGLYGVQVGAAFFGESMFHRVTDASKVALHALVCILQGCHFELLDIQWTTDHLKQFGAIDISRREYLVRLKAAIKAHVLFPKQGEYTLPIENR